MAFLKETDYDPQIRGWVKNIITGGNTTTLNRAELAAQAEMESYLLNRYKVGDIFTPMEGENDNRNALVVMYLIDMTVYHLHANISPENVPEIRHVRYQAAIDWLKKVAKGDISPNLPELSGDPEEPESENSVFFQAGSNEKVSGERY